MCTTCVRAVRFARAVRKWTRNWKRLMTKVVVEMNKRRVMVVVVATSLPSVEWDLN
ncbi:hypothetical protein DPMN_132034 [Dreissena polymorpha]|uniref:Uncharacterized protein n=1 Tax=Dreissena polymorpha TaxID=45954 RepID=A0A9D4J8I2_DREPO|nr:hypothetical protein DPMN_132034 [Dreissena polymorpha]